MAGLPDPAIAPITQADLPRILALNAVYQHQTSPLDLPGLAHLVGQACHTGAVQGGAAGFLIALDQTAEYASPNFRWFQTRFDRFCYVDRVVVAPRAQNQRLATRLYQRLIAARPPHAPRIGCEVNLIPPNPASAAFHARFGFVEIGRQSFADGAKVVRYLVREG